MQILIIYFSRIRRCCVPGNKIAVMDVILKPLTTHAIKLPNVRILKLYVAQNISALKSPLLQDWMNDKYNRYFW